MNEKLDRMRRGSLGNREPASNKCPKIISVDGCAHINVRHVKVNRTLKFIARNYNQPFNLAKLVEISQMSRRGLLKAFISHTGMSPGQLLRQVRIEQSKQLLTENDLRLTEIAELSGYGKLNSFCVAFRRVTGVAPKRFQRQAWLKSYKTQVNGRRNAAIRQMAQPRLLGLKRPIRSRRIK